MKGFAVLQFFETDRFFFETDGFFFCRVLSDLLPFDPLKNETLMEQLGTEAYCPVNLLLYQLVVPPEASCHMIRVLFPQFYQEFSSEFPLSLKFVSGWKKRPSQELAGE